MYTQAMDILFTSQEQIISFTKDINERKNGLPKFIDYFLLNHLVNYKDKETLQYIEKTLKIQEG